MVESYNLFFFFGHEQESYNHGTRNVWPVPLTQAELQAIVTTLEIANWYRKWKSTCFYSDAKGTVNFVHRCHKTRLGLLELVRLLFWEHYYNFDSWDCERVGVQNWKNTYAHDLSQIEGCYMGLLMCVSWRVVNPPLPFEWMNACVLLFIKKNKQTTKRRWMRMWQSSSNINSQYFIALHLRCNEPTNYQIILLLMTEEHQTIHNIYFFFSFHWDGKVSSR